MNSTVNLYKVGFKPTQNAYVDNLATYLAGFESPIAGYDTLEYIDKVSKGDYIYFNTEYLPTTKTKVVFDATRTDPHASGAFFGCKSSGMRCFQVQWENDTVLYIWYANATDSSRGNTNKSISGQWTLNQKTHIEADFSSFKANDATIALPDPSTTWTATRTLKIWGRVWDSDPEMIAKFALHNFNIYEDGVLVRQYVPVRSQATQELGLYDKVNGTFKTLINGTSDKLIAGPVKQMNPKLTINNFQYFKHQASTSIKINMMQDEVDNIDYNYVSIQNEGTSPQPIYYYYIVGSSWISQNTVKLELALDTINSLGQDTLSPANPRNFTKKTVITREHKDRFKEIATYDKTIANTLVRNIDRLDEGSITNKIQISSTNISENIDKAPDDDWYLIYRTRANLTPENIANPIETILTSGTPIPLTSTGEAERIYTFGNFEDGNYYYFTDLDNPSGSFKDFKVGPITNYFTGTLGNTYYVNSQIPDSGTSLLKQNRKLRGFIIHRVGQYMYCKFMYDNNVAWRYIDGANTYRCSALNGPVIPSSEVVTSAGILDNSWIETSTFTLTKGIKFRYSINDLSSQTPEGLLSSAINTINAVTGAIQYTTSIDAFDRTDSRLMKIIKLPYCPISLVKSNTTPAYYSLPDNSGWIIAEGSIKWNRSDVPNFYVNKACEDLDLSNDLTVTIPAGITVNDVPQITYESKLLHSNFYTNKLVYDSFGHEIKYEDLDLNWQSTTPKISIDFKASDTLNSNFAFKINPNETQIQTDDFDKYLIISRNNEELICSNDYVNYIRNGYNYDKKAQALQVRQAAIQSAINIVTTAASFTSTIAGVLSNSTKSIDKKLAGMENQVEDYIHSKEWEQAANYPKNYYNDLTTKYNALSDKRDNIIKSRAVGATTNLIALNQGIQFGSSALSSLISLGTLIESNKITMTGKLANLSSQSTKVNNCDDLSLMSWYAGNKLVNFKYWLSDNQRKVIYDTFYYAGYNNNNKRATPDVDSRIWFNYLQCTPDLEYTGINNLKKVLTDDLITKYQLGVTVFHAIDGKYDFEQDKENYETWMFN